MSEGAFVCLCVRVLKNHFIQPRNIHPERKRIFVGVGEVEDVI